MNDQDKSRVVQSQLFSAGIAGWFAYLVIDFLIHAVLLATWWRETESYWLPVNELVNRIPFAYASFGIYCGVLVWLLRRFYGERVNLSIGLQFGAITGFLFGLGSVLVTYSVFPMPYSALVVWPISFLLESTIASGVISLVLIAERPWRRVGAVILAAIVVFIIGVVVQNIFFPTP